MIGYAMAGVADLERAARFYDPLFAEMGLAPCYGDEQVRSWGDPDDEAVARFFACLPYDGGAAGAGNGAMTAFRVRDTAAVNRLHALALGRGGADEGAPGLRPERYGERFYVAYVRDPDGNKLAFYAFLPRPG